VGEEVVAFVKKLGINITKTKKWYGEDKQDRYQEFISDFKNISNVSESDIDVVAPAIWRRHGNQSFEILKSFKENEDYLERIFPELELTLGECVYIVDNEMVQKSEDLWRRRTSISMIRSADEISQNRLIQRVNALI
jgi:glycerol-3-phosphate dehydrogenase